MSIKKVGRVMTNIEVLVGNCPNCKLRFCLFDKCSRYKQLYPRLELVNLSKFKK